MPSQTHKRSQFTFNVLLKNNLAGIRLFSSHRQMCARRVVNGVITKEVTLCSFAMAIYMKRKEWSQIRQSNNVRAAANRSADDRVCTDHAEILGQRQDHFDFDRNFTLTSFQSALSDCKAMNGAGEEKFFKETCPNNNWSP